MYSELSCEPDDLRSMCVLCSQTCRAGQWREALVAWLLQTRETKHSRYCVFRWAFKCKCLQITMQSLKG